jgi:mycothiol synthase
LATAISITTSQLQIEFDAPEVDRDRDFSLWENDRGQLIGLGALSIAEPIADNLANGRLWFIVHPATRDGGLEAQIIAWAEHRMSEVGKERHGQPKLFTWSLSSQLDRIALIQQHGFVENRHFFNLLPSQCRIRHKAEKNS